MPQWRVFPAWILALAVARAELLETAPDLQADLLLSDPHIAQPVHLSFDQRGRLWVVEYRQYPEPAGLKIVERDDFWRIRYDALPPPPPHAPGSKFRGKDRISIHEDTDGDGSFDAHKIFVDGLNICTSIALDAGGVWVLNPPYLLYYPDENRDDLPDREPVVHLSGFGIEDTHSNANSLRWGPDGWLYGCNGSTVSLKVGSPLADPPPPLVVRSGQCIWRYHPSTHRFEIFAEGGGNSFGIEIDSEGRLFSGHNGGDTRGFHFLRGGFYRKNFGKHGDLSNPYAYGYFPAMSHHKVPRFSHHFVKYEAAHLPERYRGKLLALDILHNNVAMAEITPLGSTFKTRDLERPIQGSATFRPQHMITGPDGALYLADWGDIQVNHFRNHEGQINKQSGRIYRIRTKGPLPTSMPVASDPVSLLFELGSTNRARRQTALRLIREIQPLSIEPSLRARLRMGTNGPSAIDGLWALHALGQTSPQLLLKTADHPSPAVSRWSFRLMHETGCLQEPQVQQALLQAVESSKDPELLAEILCLGRDLPPADALRLALTFVNQKKFDDDPHLPLLTWWLIENATRDDPSELVSWCRNRQLWSAILFRDILLERMARRLVEAGDRKSLAACGALLDQSRDDWSAKQILEGIAKGLEGTAGINLPHEFTAALLRQKALLPPGLQLRLGFEGAVERTFQHLKRTPDQSGVLLDVLAEVHPPAALEPLLALILARDPDPNLLPRAIRCLQAYDSPVIPRRLIPRLATLAPEARAAAALTLASRLSWSRITMNAVRDGRLDPAHLGAPAARRMQLHRDAPLDALIISNFPEMSADPHPLAPEMIRIRTVLRGGKRGNLERGKELYRDRCAACHTLYDQGRPIGPDLTSYQRSDLDALILAIVSPNAELREGFETAVVSLRDESIVTGFLRHQDPKSVEVLDLVGNRRVIPRDSVRSLEIVPNSLMPAGLLDGLAEKDLRSLFAFLTQVR